MVDLRDAPPTTRAIVTTDRSIGSRPPRKFSGWRFLIAFKGFLFSVPFIIGFVAVFLIPFIYALVQSLFIERRSGSGLGGATTEFAGLENFARGAVDPVFWEGVLRVVLFASIQVPIMLVISLSMALMLDQMVGRGVKFFRIGLLVPHMIPGIVATLIWLYLYSPRLGPITPTLGFFGIDVNFFSSTMVMFSIGNLLTWGAIGFNMLILYSSLRSVPRELFEAARLDGASEVRIAWSIKVPYVRGTVILTTMLSIIGTLQIFNEPTVFRVTSPETVTARFTPIMMIYNEMTAGNYNYAAALSVMLAVIVGVGSAVFYFATNRRTS